MRNLQTYPMKYIKKRTVKRFISLLTVLFLRSIHILYCIKYYGGTKRLSQRKNYSRYFIILQEDEKGYGLSSDKMPTGYAKLEVKSGKCKITFYVQNLKIEMKPYYIMLICNKKDERKLIKLSELNIDNTGRAEICKEFEASNIGGSSIAVDKVSGAAVVKYLDDSLIPVLSGFTTNEKPKDWKRYDLMDMGKKPTDAVKLTNNDVKDFDKYEEEIEKIKQTKEAPIKVQEKISKKEMKNDNKDEVNVKVDNISDKKVEISEIKQEYDDVIDASNVIEDLDVNETIENNEENEPKNTSKEEKQEVQEVQEVQELKEVKEAQKVQKAEVRQNEEINKNIESSYSRKKHKDKSKAQEFFDGLVEDLEPFEDGFSEIGRSRWFEVPVNSIDDMYRANSYNKYAIIYYPMINYYPYIIKHRHYIVGYKYDKSNNVKYIMYGVPGTKEHKDQPFSGRYGFVSFVNRDSDLRGENGYWMLFYDFKRAVVVIPTNK
ncbi:hypothetical protein SAMN02745134_02842 [Clostridium acidisoli DSM 12555]|uniref:Transmembrane protein n=1 Tax=Clostridium acidisoli DSM 12555 TaxID=1121291 RepID=A0A1W1XR37_9CLOT|nr:hypothetical protein SAMN02745134_02842 [Clostridium acidisoli DSM 12555]